MQSHWGVRELLVTLKLPYLIVLQTQPPYKGLSLPQGSGQTSEPYRGCATHPCSPPGGVSALPGAPEARSHLLLSLPSTSKQPQCSKCLLAPLQAAQSFLPAAAPAEHYLRGRKGQMSSSDQQPRAQISPTAVMGASAFP